MDKKRFCNNILGLILSPLCVSVTIAFAYEVIKKNWSPNIAFFFLGATLYLLIHLFFHKPILSYVTGHEVTHALWGILFGAKVKKMKVSKGGGSVAMTKTNLLVSLAPYIFPIYTFLVMIVYFILNIFWPSEWLTRLCVFLVGFSFSFHIILSMFVLRTRQSDLNAGGFWLSIVIIYLSNIFVLTIIFTLISHRVALGSFFIAAARETKLIYCNIYSFFSAIVERARTNIRQRAA